MTYARHLIAAALAVGITATTAQAELKAITIGTNPSGSTYFLIGSAFAKTIQEQLGIRTTTQPYTGSSMYLPAIHQGEITLGLSSTVDLDLAYKGERGYPIEMTSLRTLAQVWDIPYAFVTRADSGIVTADDLKGRTVMGEMPSSEALTVINEAIVKSGGLDIGEVDFLTSGGLMDGITAVVEGRADAAPVATTMPVLIESNAATPGGLRVVANGSQGDAAFFASLVPGVRPSVASPSERAPFVIGETLIVSYASLLVGSASLSDADAYQLTKTIYDNWTGLQSSTGPLRSVSQAQLAPEAPTVPYHSGAIRFFKEVGLWTDAHQANQDKF